MLDQSRQPLLENLFHVEFIYQWGKDPKGLDLTGVIEDWPSDKIHPLNIANHWLKLCIGEQNSDQRLLDIRFPEVWIELKSALHIFLYLA